MQQAIINERHAERNRVWPVGKGRYTTYDGLNPADASHLGWGTWALDAEMAGRVAVGAGSITIDYSAAIMAKLGVVNHLTSCSLIVL